MVLGLIVGRLVTRYALLLLDGRWIDEIHGCATISTCQKDMCEVPFLLMSTIDSQMHVQSGSEDWRVWKVPKQDNDRLWWCCQSHMFLAGDYFLYFEQLTSRGLSFRKLPLSHFDSLLSVLREPLSYCFFCVVVCAKLGTKQKHIQSWADNDTNHFSNEFFST